MIQIFINKIPHQFPTEWNDVSINQYEKLITRIEQLREKELGDITRIANIAATILNIDVTEIYFMPVTQFNKIIEALQFVMDEPAEIALQDEYVINNKKYKLNKELDKLTTGQVISYEIKTQEYKDTPVKSLAPAVAMVLVGEGAWNPDEYLEFIDLIGDTMGIETAMSLSAFFLDGVTNSIRKDSKFYSQAKTLINKQATSTTSDGLE